MSAALAIQNALYTLLRGNAGLTALLATNAIEASGSAVYDRPPQPDEAESAIEFPYLVIGDDTAAEFDTDDTNGQETTVTVHVWDRYRGKKRIKQIQDALYAALHDVALTVTGHTAVYCLWEYSENVPDPDGLTQHAVSRFRIVTQDT